MGSLSTASCGRLSRDLLASVWHWLLASVAGSGKCVDMAASVAGSGKCVDTAASVAEISISCEEVREVMRKKQTRPMSNQAQPRDDPGKMNPG